MDAHVRAAGSLKGWKILHVSAKALEELPPCTPMAR